MAVPGTQLVWIPACCHSLPAPVPHHTDFYLLWTFLGASTSSFTRAVLYMIHLWGVPSSPRPSPSALASEVPGNPLWLIGAFLGLEEPYVQTTGIGGHRGN